MEFNAACEKAEQRLKELGYMERIIGIVDVGDKWLFFGTLDDEPGYDYGNNPVSVSKITGEVDEFYLGDVDNYELYEKGATVEIPERYQRGEKK